MTFPAILTGGAPLVSDLYLELAEGTRVPLGHSFVLPPGLPGVGAQDSGDRAPDSEYVVRSGDELPTIYSVTVPGVLSATSPTALLDTLDVFETQLLTTRKVWRGDRCHLFVAYGLLPQPEMRKGWLSCDVTPVFRLTRLGWFRPDGTKTFG